MELNKIKIKTKIITENKTAQKATPLLNMNQTGDITKNNPKVVKFNNDFKLMQINTFTTLSPTDATILNTIQANIRQKLRALGVQPTP